MTFKVNISPSMKRLLQSNQKKGLIDDVRKEFSKRGPIKVKQAIVQDMIKGISPVKGGGRWSKYSDSYKTSIKKGAYSRYSKKVTPINLRLSGALHKSLKVFLSGQLLFIEFNNFLADIHNRRGAGKSKIIRRLLPIKKGEQFNRKITTVIYDQLRKAVNVVAKQFSGQ